MAAFTFTLLKYICNTFSRMIAILLILLLSALVLLFILVPTILFRKFASLLILIFRPDLEKLVSSRSCLLALEDIHGKPNANAVVCIVFKEAVKIKLEDIKTQVKNKGLKARNSKDGTLKFPELKQYYEQWLGFLFWKWDTEFNFDNHFQVYDESCKRGEINGENKLLSFMTELQGKPWPKCRSPWEILMISNYSSVGQCSENFIPFDNNEVEKKSVLIFRFHHSLADGYSMMKLLLHNIAENNDVVLVKPKFDSERSLSVMKILSVLVKGPYKYVENLLESAEINEWHSPQIKLSTNLNSSISEKILVKDVKYIMAKYKVSFVAVLNAAISGGIRKVMKESDTNIPQSLHAGMTFPFPGHPDKLTNHFSIALAKIPVGISDESSRIKKCEENMQGLKISPIPIVSFYFSKLIGCLPFWILKTIKPHFTSPSIGIIIFPAPVDVIHFMGMEIEEVISQVGLLNHHTGVGFFIVSYRGSFRILITADHKIISSNIGVQNLAQRIKDEINLLKREA